MNDHATGLVITLAYPDTVVMVAEEWYSPLLRLVGIGKKNYVKAGHSALVLIHKEKGDLEYHDFGRYITLTPYGRVRCAYHDAELKFPIKAKLKDGEIDNLEELLLFLSNNPELTHGNGKLVASVAEVNYSKTKKYIREIQSKGALRYAAFARQATNCARFVACATMAGTLSNTVRKRLQRSLLFTPSTIGNVIRASSTGVVYEVNNDCVATFKSSILKENLKCFLDKLDGYEPSLEGSLLPKKIDGVLSEAQWLGGIGSGAWFEVTKNEVLQQYQYRFRRISPYGNIDIDAVLEDVSKEFSIDEMYTIAHESHCQKCIIIQKGKKIVLEYVGQFSLEQKEHLV